MCPWNKILALPNCCKNWVLQKEPQRKRTLKHKQALGVSQVQPQYHNYIHTPLPLLRKRETERERKRDVCLILKDSLFVLFALAEQFKNSSS